MLEEKSKKFSHLSETTKQTIVFLKNKLVVLTNELVQTKVSTSLQTALFSEKENLYQSKQDDLNLQVSRLWVILSDVESRSREQISHLSECWTASSKSTSRTTFTTKNPKVKTTSSPIFYGKAGTRTKLKKKNDFRCKM